MWRHWAFEGLFSRDAFLCLFCLVWESPLLPVRNTIYQPASRYDA